MPTWQRKLNSFEKVMDRIWAESPAPVQATITTQVVAVMRKYFTKAKAKKDIASAIEIPQKICGTPLEKYAAKQKEAAPC